MAYLFIPTTSVLYQDTVQVTWYSTDVVQYTVHIPVYCSFICFAESKTFAKFVDDVDPDCASWNEERKQSKEVKSEARQSWVRQSSAKQIWTRAMRRECGGLSSSEEEG